MDESAFRQALHGSEPQACPFGKAILARCCACTLSRKSAIAEREVVICTQAAAREQCRELNELLRRNSLFALKPAHTDEPLTHANNMKVQCGGLRGLQQALDATQEISNVAGLVEAARRKFGSLDELPYSLIIQSVAEFRLRRPHDRQ